MDTYLSKSSCKFENSKRTVHGICVLLSYFTDNVQYSFRTEQVIITQLHKNISSRFRSSKTSLSPALNSNLFLLTILRRFLCPSSSVYVVYCTRTYAVVSCHCLFLISYCISISQLTSLQRRGDVIAMLLRRCVFTRRSVSREGCV